MAKELKNVVALKDDAAPNTDIVNKLVEKLGLNGVVKTTVDHNRFSTLGVTAAVLLLGVVKGLKPTTADPYYSNQTATADTIDSEHDQILSDLNQQIAASKKRVADMGVQVQAARQKLIDQEKEFAGVLQAVGTLAAPFAGPAAPLVLAVTGLITAGITADTVRKSGVANAATNAANASTGTLTPPAPGNPPANSSDDLLQQIQQNLGLVGNAITSFKGGKK